MMHKAWSSMEEVPYCFSRSYVKFQGHTALKIVEFDPNWEFPDCNSSLNSPMAMKCCTKLETAQERCPFVFQGHPSNLKVTRYKTSPILTQIGCFRTIGRSQFSNPSDLPCSRSSIKCQGHTGRKIDDSNQFWVRLLGWSQQLNLSDLPCFQDNENAWEVHWEAWMCKHYILTSTLVQATSGNKPLPEPMITQIYGAIWSH